MFRFVVSRLAGLIPLLLVVSAFVFVLGQYGAGDIAAYLTFQRSGGRFDQELYDRYRDELGLDDPVVVRYTTWLANALRGDLGRSYVAIGEPEIAGLLVRSLPITLQLASAALFIVTCTAVPIGFITALYRNSLLDRLLVAMASVLSTVPAFVLAPLSMIVIVNQLHLLPSVGLGWRGLFSQETILPAACLAAGPFLNLVRFTRASVLEVLSQDYIRAAYARGLSSTQVIIHHVVRNSLTPVITVLGLTAGQLVGSTLFVEAIFNLQGFGQVVARALTLGDIQTATAGALVATVIVLLSSLVVDVIYVMVDPRVKLS
ncbi:MAG: ABC transporter permease [Anaerolineae bacterium]|nr:ABC transporter permease [Anaerolineae bacterium]